MSDEQIMTAIIAGIRRGKVPTAKELGVDPKRYTQLAHDMQFDHRYVDCVVFTMGGGIPRIAHFNTAEVTETGALFYDLVSIKNS